jgi:Holliday junction DNA helicase RuvA
MIAQVRGEPVAYGERDIVLDVNGVGYQIQVTQPAIQRIRGMKAPVRLFTYMAVREDAITLYGFLEQSELEVFRILIGVTGIGPQSAMGILSQAGIEDLVMAILNEDEKTLTKIPGIGPKSAKRLILELRDKMRKVRTSLVLIETRAHGPAAGDATSALISLGFSEKESAEAVKAAVSEVGSGSGTVQDLVKSALAKMKER